jgi:hypothetical protein
VCAAYSGTKLDACNSTAWTYYHAVDIFGVAPARTNADRLPQAA